MSNINVEEIKKYNEGLKAHTERAAKIKAELEINTNELNRLCSELTQELGVKVTPENIDLIYKENVEKINNTLKVGTDVLRRIEEEEAAVVNQLNTPVSVDTVNVIGNTVGEVDDTPTFIPNPGAFGGMQSDVGELPPFNLPDTTIKI